MQNGTVNFLQFDDPCSCITSTGNEEYNNHMVRFSYSSFTDPMAIYDYDVNKRVTILRKKKVIPGYNPGLYKSERLYARASDGAFVPISLVYRADKLNKCGSNPLYVSPRSDCAWLTVIFFRYLIGYGAYGLTVDPTFSSKRLSLLDRGVIFAIAHVTGFGKMLN